MEWFEKWKGWCDLHQMEAGNIINFDEAGFQIGVTCGEEIIIPGDIEAVRTILYYNIQSNSY
jgi:hypothetical protein